MTTTPDMQGAARTIDDPGRLYARIGYRVWREHQRGEPGFYAGHNAADLRRLDELAAQREGGEPR